MQESKSNPIGPIIHMMISNPIQGKCPGAKEAPFGCEGTRQLLHNASSTGTHFRHLYVSGAVAMPAYIVIRMGVLRVASP